MSTGIASGSTSTAMRRPPRRSDTVSAAPIAPIMVSAGVPAASVAATSASGVGAMPSIRPKIGEMLGPVRGMKLHLPLEAWRRDL